jgi:TolB protein
MESDDSGDNVFHLGIADVQSARERVVTRFVNRTSYGLRWSPDGSRLTVCLTSLTGNVAESSELAVIDVADGTVWVPQFSPWTGPFSAPEWSPDGRSLIVGQGAEPFSHVSDQPGQIMQVDLDSGEARPLFWSPIRMPRNGWAFSAFTALDADRVVFDQNRARASLYEIDLEDPQGRRAPTRLTHSLGRDRQPAYSPDGRRIIFSSNRSGNIDLWTYDRQTGTVRQLTDDPSDDWDPAYSPDGREVLWSSTRSGPLEIWAANADGSAARQVSDDGVDAENPTMTPGDGWVVYSSTNDTKRGIWRIRPDGTDATRIYEGSSLLPEVSPDGRYALFVVFRNLNYQIRVVEIETAELLPFRISIDTIERHQSLVYGRARWTPDGKGIVYIGQNEAGFSGVHVQDFAREGDTTDSRRELFGFERGLIVESLGLSPDGRHLAVSVVEQQRILKLVQDVGLRGWERP